MKEQWRTHIVLPQSEYGDHILPTLDQTTRPNINVCVVEMHYD